MMGLRDLAYQISPTWLQGANGEKYVYAQAVMGDVTADRVEQGSRAKMPQKCDPTALDYIGRDRDVVRGLSETDASYALRCKSSIYDHHFMGMAGGVMQAILGYISPAAPLVRIVWAAFAPPLVPTQWTWINDSAPHGAIPDSWDNESPPYFAPWYWDTSNNRRRFWVILYVNATGTPWITDGRKYGDGSLYGDGHLYGVAGVTAAQVSTIRALVKDWKAAHSYCACIVVPLDSTLFDPFYAGDLPGDNSKLPDGTWADYGVDVGGVYQPARFANARYLGSVG